MTTFKELFILHWNFSANDHRYENTLDQLFLTNGNGMEWNNGELEYMFDSDIHRPTPESIAEHAWRQSEGSIPHDYDEGETREHKASYWYDMFLEVHQNKIAQEVPLHMYLTDGYDAITRIPDDITEEYAGALLLVCDWFDKIEYDTYYEAEIETMRSQWFGSYYDKDKEIIAANPKWKAIDDANKEATKDMELHDKIMYTDLEWNDMRKEVSNIIKEEIKPKADESMKKNFKKIVKYRTETRDKIKQLHPDVVDYDIEALNLTRDTSLPDWYVADEDRKGYNHYEQGGYKNICG